MSSANYASSRSTSNPSDTIFIHNCDRERRIFAVVYSGGTHKTQYLLRCGFFEDIMEIEPGAAREIFLPSRQLVHSRQVIASLQASSLTERLPKSRTLPLGLCTLPLSGDDKVELHRNFYVRRSRDGSTLEAHRHLTEATTVNVPESAELDPELTLRGAGRRRVLSFERRVPRVQDHANYTESSLDGTAARSPDTAAARRAAAVMSMAASVNTSGAPEAAERDFLRQRQRVCHKRLEGLCLTHMGVEEAPRIALALCGGGYASLIASLGFLSGAERTGLLDLASVVAATGAPAAALAGWVHSEEEQVAAYARQLRGTDIANAMRAGGTLELVRASMVSQLANGRPVGETELRGCSVSSVLLGSGRDRMEVGLASGMAQRLRPRIHPLPVFGAASPVLKGSGWRDSELVELTPFSVRTLDSPASIPADSFGMEFDAGFSASARFSEPELPLSTVIGLYSHTLHVPRLHDRELLALLDAGTGLAARLVGLLQVLKF